MVQGADAERELLHLLWEMDYATVRIAGSGASRTPSPDLLCSNGDLSYAIECKSSSKNKIYIQKEQLNELYEFARAFKCLAVIGVRFAYMNWKIMDPAFLKDCGKNYRVDRKTAYYHGLPISNL